MEAKYRVGDTLTFRKTIEGKDESWSEEGDQCILVDVDLDGKGAEVTFYNVPMKALRIGFLPKRLFTTSNPLQEYLEDLFIPHD